jgi:SurA-like protein
MPLRTVPVSLFATLVLAACGGSSSSPVAQVGGESITRSELADTVDHFKQEAEAEGRDFPAQDTDEYRIVERQALGLLVYRSELQQSAKKLGVPVTDEEVQQRMSSSEENDSDRTFAEDTVRAQLAYEHIYTRVTAGATPAGREAAMRAWITEMKQAYKDKTSYEAGYGPAP